MKKRNTQFSLQSRLLILLIPMGWLLSLIFHPGKPDFSDLPSPLSKIEIVQEEPEQYWRRLYSQKPTLESSCRWNGLEKLGLVKNNEESPKKDLLDSDLFPIDGVGGAFYKVGSDTIFTTDKQNARQIRHEWIHALHDQYGGLHQYFEKAKTTDELFALKSVAEGTAILFSSPSEIYHPSSRYLQENLMYFAYGLSMEYVEHKAKNDILGAFAVHPKSLYEVMWLRTRTPVEIPPAAQEGYALLCSDRLGIAGILSIIELLKLPDNEKDMLLKGWNGDRMDVLKDINGSLQVVWTVSFDSREAEIIWKKGPYVLLPLTRDGVRAPILSTK